MMLKQQVEVVDFLCFRTFGVRIMDVRMIKTDQMIDKFRRAEEFGQCPECGATMTEKDRLAEGRNIYIWFECSRSDCYGQWMQKKKRDSFAGVGT
jgi:hypothetical protein